MADISPPVDNHMIESAKPRRPAHERPAYRNSSVILAGSAGRQHLNTRRSVITDEGTGMVTPRRDEEYNSEHCESTVSLP